MKMTISNWSKVLLAMIFVSLASNMARANTRTLEMRFALSADARSEFTTRFPVISVGRIVIDANWSTPNSGGVTTGLTLTLIRPDGSIAVTKNGTSAIRFEYRANEQDIENFGTDTVSKWTLKVLNNAETKRSEISGTLRITVPVEIRTLEDTQFTLLGSGNAQEIAFSLPGPGRLEVQTNWNEEGLSQSSSILLTVSLVHPGESKIYARRQGASPIKVDQQISEEALDRGSRWVVRLQNDTQTKVSGRVIISYTPSL